MGPHTGDPTQGDTVTSGTLWARYLVPRTLGDSSVATELAMATTAVKETKAHRIQAGELRQVARGPSWLYLDATAVLHGASPDKATRGMKHLAAKLAIV